MSDQQPSPLRRHLPVLVEIAQALVGLALLFVGLWQLYPPAAFIVAGALLWRDATAPTGGRSPAKATPPSVVKP